MNEIWPHLFARPLGRDAWHVAYAILHLGRNEVLADDERTEQLASEQPHLRRERRTAWVVPGGQKALGKYLGMGERSIRNCLRQIEKTWFPEGGYFAIWRKDRAKKRQEVNAYDVDELRARLQARLAHPTLPLREAIKLAPGEPGQAPLPLDATALQVVRPGQEEEPSQEHQNLDHEAVDSLPSCGPVARGGPSQEPEKCQEVEPAAAEARVEDPAFLPPAGGAVPPPTSYFAPDDSNVGSNPSIRGCDRLEEGGLHEAIRGIHEGFSAPEVEIETPAEPPELVAEFEELGQLLEEEETAPQHDGRARGGVGRPEPRRAVSEQPAPSVAVPEAPEEPAGRAGGGSCRQEDRSRSRSLDPFDPDTTHAPARAHESRTRTGRSRRRQRRRVVSAQPEELNKAKLIRDRFPGFWPAEALVWAKKHSRDHLELCLSYVDVECSYRKIENLFGYLREVFRSASPSSMKLRLAQEERQRAALRLRQAERQRQEPSPEEIAAYRAEYQRCLEEQAQRQTSEGTAPPHGGEKGEAPLLEIKPSTSEEPPEDRFAGWEATRRQAAELGIDTDSPGWLFKLASVTGAE